MPHGGLGCRQNRRSPRKELVSKGTRMRNQRINPRPVISSSIQAPNFISANSAATEAKTTVASDSSPDRTVERAGKSGRASSAWEWSICATVLLLFASATLEREHQLFQQLNVPQVFSQKTITIPRPTGLDFAVYYVTGRVVLGEGGSRLYYSPPGSKAEQHRTLLEGGVPVDTPWSRVAERSLGIRTTTYYIYPPFFALLFSPIARMRPITAYFAWRGLSTMWVLLSMYLQPRPMAGYCPSPLAPTPPYNQMFRSTTALRLRCSSM